MSLIIGLGSLVIRVIFITPTGGAVLTLDLFFCFWINVMLDPLV